MTSPMSPSIDAAGASGPVFLVGMNGSGTTMLCHSLGNHPDLYGCKRETRVLPHFIAHLHRYGTLADDDNFLRLMRDIYALRAFRQLNGGRPVPLPEDWATMPRDLASIVDTAFRYFAAQEHKKRWADKTPRCMRSTSPRWPVCSRPRASYMSFAMAATRRTRSIDAGTARRR